MQLESESAQTTKSAASSITASPSDAAAALPSPQAAAISDRAAAGDAAAVEASAGSKRKSRNSESAGSTEVSAGSAQRSSSAAAASASNSHPAPEVDSTASEPNSKRARPTPPIATPIPDSSMLRLLGRESGARQSLIEMLTFAEFTALLRSSRSWSVLTAESTRIPSVSLHDSSLEGFSRSRWFPRSVHSVKFTTPCWSNNMCTRLFAPLSQCIRLRSLTLVFSGFVVSCPQLHNGLASVASTLQHLSVLLCSSQAGLLPDVFSALSKLQQLRSLAIKAASANAEMPTSLWDLSPLVLLPYLERFSANSLRPCTHAQVESLSQCLQLTHLEFGQWLQSDYGSSLLHVDAITGGFATLIRRRKENGAAPLRRLHLGPRPLIEPAGWRSLSQCTELESIDAHWCPTLSAADWSRLSSFQHLQSLFIKSVSGNVLNWDPILSPLLHCRVLHTLKLKGRNQCFTLRAEHVTLMARIPALKQFSAVDLVIESLEPLSAAPALTALEFDRCTGLEGKPIIREMIPTMPRLRLLAMRPREISAGAREASNTALLQRMPRLVTVRFDDE